MIFRVLLGLEFYDLVHLDSQKQNDIRKSASCCFVEKVWVKGVSAHLNGLMISCASRNSKFDLPPKQTYICKHCTIV